MAVAQKSVTISVPAEDSEAAQQDQTVRLVFGLERLLRQRRGLLVATRWRRNINKFLTTPGTTYEQIRTRLENDFNLELTLTHNELMQIINT